MKGFMYKITTTEMGAAFWAAMLKYVEDADDPKDLGHQMAT